MDLSALAKQHEHDIKKLIERAKREKWSELRFANKYLTTLPPEIGYLKDLNWLDLSGNKLTTLPPEVGKLNALNWFDISGNSLSNLPSEIGHLESLTWLDLSNNNLKGLPSQIGHLKNLVKLNLSGNQLSEIPYEIGGLIKLVELDLMGNKIASIPSTLGKMRNLASLNLSGNWLSLLPSEIGELTNLKKLDLSWNQVTTLPPHFGQLIHLTELDLWNNPIRVPPPEILNLDKNGKADLAKLRQYFKQLAEVGEERLFEAKLLIVGEAGAGKTSLARKIRNSSLPLPSPEESTEGIDVNSWDFPIFERSEISQSATVREEETTHQFRVNIWDFGGQEIYHATHQFFLTHRSLYLLVADAREQKTDFDYWLHAVKTLSGDSPLIIVVNEKEGRRWHIDSGRLQKQFGNLAATLNVDLKTNLGLNHLVATVKRHISELPHVGDILPRTWVDVRRELETDPRPYISLQTYLEICQSKGFTRIEDKLQLSGYLHDLGVCLHFQDDDILKYTVILDPEWGTNAVYRVLDNDQLINSQGHFNRDDLKAIWSEEEYSLMRGDLLALMMKFQLCYEIPHNVGHYIAPQLLNQMPPNYFWNEKNNLILRYVAPDFMPKGIIARFIVVIHRYIENQLVWRYGVVLAQENARAEVIEVYNKREIRIRITGTNKRDLLNAVTWELDKIFNSFHELKFLRLIPCNCSVCKGSQKPHFYKLEDLKRRLAKGKSKVECYESYEMVDVRVLLEDATGVEDPVTIVEKLKTQFSESELKMCCFYFDIDYEDLQGNNRAESAQNLVMHFQRRGRLQELIEYINRERP